jgi:hypothetical protein
VHCFQCSKDFDVIERPDGSALKSVFVVVVVFCCQILLKIVLVMIGKQFWR